MGVWGGVVSIFIFLILSMPDSIIKLLVPDEAHRQRIDQWLAEVLPQFSRNCLKQWIEEGKVTVNGNTVIPRYLLQQGTDIQVITSPHPQEKAFTAEDIPLDIVYEDNDLLVINKPSGLVVHPAAGHWQGTLQNGLLHHAPVLFDLPRAGLVHRLDQDTSGLMVVAKNLTAHTSLVRQLQERTMRRCYWALVEGRVPTSGKVELAIGRHPRYKTRMTVRPTDASGAKMAVTHYRPLQYLQAERQILSLLECRLETGRTHQIRVHLQHLKYPVVGDTVYGSGRYNQYISRQALHAKELALHHPSSGILLTWKVELPSDIKDLLAQFPSLIESRYDKKGSQVAVRRSITETKKPSVW